MHKFHISLNRSVAVCSLISRTDRAEGSSVPLVCHPSDSFQSQSCSVVSVTSQLVEIQTQGPGLGRPALCKTGPFKKASEWRFMCFHLGEGRKRRECLLQTKVIWIRSQQWSVWRPVEKAWAHCCPQMRRTSLWFTM